MVPYIFIRTFHNIFFEKLAIFVLKNFSDLSNDEWPRFVLVRAWDVNSICIDLKMPLPHSGTNKCIRKRNRKKPTRLARRKIKVDFYNQTDIEIADWRS